MQILYHNDIHYIGNYGDQIVLSDDTTYYSIYRNGKVYEYFANNHDTTVANIDDIDVPNDFYQTSNKYIFDPDNSAIIPNPDYVPPLEDRLTDIVNKLTQVQESQDNQDAVIAALLELL